ncbi:MAG TPA: efflux RND transporter periplasmic adaptor subunit [Rhodothermales bacterium]|nr:efflux RND transporter periplasmic adaptor subunit [Rhodothermales bacterium]
MHLFHGLHAIRGLGKKNAALLALVFVLALAGCSNRNEADAYGNFEADETLISSQAAGELITFAPDEGEILGAGQVVGVVDTVDLSLQRQELAANRSAVYAQSAGVLSQIGVLQEQRETAEKDRARIRQLVSQQAATPQQLDEINGRIQVIDQQIASIRTQNRSALSQLDVLDAKLAQLEHQIRESRIVNPVRGTVLVTYADPHELVAPGKPLYRIADLDTMYLRAYVSGAQLPQVRLGEDVQVRIDDGEGGYTTLPGRVGWISSQAEFTPRMVQTKEERVNLVYAIKVYVPNENGLLKVGMPGEVVFGPPAQKEDAA